MAEERVQRRLAAILAMDVAGYSRLVGKDEETTLAALHLHRSELIDVKIGEFGGRIANTAGDSILSEFPSVVNALRCAIDVQRGIAERNLGVPADRRIEFRMGLTVGDVVDRDGDLLGDGVNVAARLEGLADPGGICLSRAARDQVRDRMEIALEDMGEVEVKNIARPVRVFRYFPSGDLASSSQAQTGARKWRIPATVACLMVIIGGVAWLQPWVPGADSIPVDRTASKPSKRPSIAVLPFTNMSGDKEQEYFADGISEDLITDLSKVSGLFVIARNSTFSYKGQSVDVRTVGKELNARYVIEGSVRKISHRVRITAQLIDAETGNHVWADRYDRDLKDIFALQDDVRERIVAALKIKLTPAEYRRLTRHATDSPEAHDLYFRGLRQESFFSKDGNRESRQLFERAVDLDPRFALAYAHLAQVYSLAIENDWTETKEKFKETALASAKKAVALDDELPQAHWSLGRVYMQPWILDLEKATAELERAVAIDPNFADGYVLLGLVLNHSGRAAEALGMIETAMRINPRFPYWYVGTMGHTQLYLGRYKDAVRSLNRAIERNPAVPWPHMYLIAAYGHLGRWDDAKWELSELESLGRHITIKSIMERWPTRDPGYRKVIEEGLRKGGVPAE